MSSTTPAKKFVIKNFKHAVTMDNVQVKTSSSMTSITIITNNT